MKRTTRVAPIGADLKGDTPDETKLQAAMMQIKIRTSWTPSERVLRRMPDGHQKLAANLAMAAQERLATACHALAMIRPLIMDGREALGWINRDVVPGGPSFAQCVESLGFDAEAAREEILAKMNPKELACLFKRGVYYCPVCGPTSVNNLCQKL